MATAIECSKVLVVFLSAEYQHSDNCMLEFNYAVTRGKAFIFILVEPNLKIAKWIEPHFNESPKFELFHVGDDNKLINNVPLIDVISQAIRNIGAAQPENDYFQLSEEVISLQEQLDDALDEISESTNTQRTKICTRCKKQYEPHKLEGCKMHSAYYLGGSILAGRWVCCRQQEEDAIGCRETTHVDKKITWTQDPDYGTYTWVLEE